MNSEITDNLAVSINCVVCGKKDIKTDTCPRCESELTIFREIIQGASVFLSQAEKALGTMQPQKAHELALRSWGLKKSPRAAVIAFLACCALGDFGEALMWYRRRRGVKE